MKQEWSVIFIDPTERNMWANANRNTFCGGLAHIHIGKGDACSAPLEIRQQRHVGQPGASWKFRAVVIGAPVPDRASLLLPGTGSLRGCKCNVNDICRERGVGRAKARQLESLFDMLNKWVDGLPPPTRTECSELLLRGGMATPDGEPEVACLALLVRALVKPKAQLFVRCGVRAGHETVGPFDGCRGGGVVDGAKGCSRMCSILAGAVQEADAQKMPDGKYGVGANRAYRRLRTKVALWYWY